MINPLELRIGNYITDKWAEKNKMFKVLTFTNTIVRYGHNLQCKIENAEPILLTEEILIKSGFEKREHCMDLFIKMPNTDTILSYRRKQLRIVGSNQIPCLHIELQHVHQLQNAFFALTGEELNITLD